MSYSDPYHVLEQDLFSFIQLLSFIKFQRLPQDPHETYTVPVWLDFNFALKML